ncbi:hypothetical protein Tco_0020460 [Tanacetum coccineum]
MSPTKSLLDVGSRRISIFIVRTFASLGCSGNTTRIMRRTLKILLVITMYYNNIYNNDTPDEVDLDCRDDVLEDPPCLKPFLYVKHELLASVDIFPCLKPCVQTRIYPADLEFLDPVVQCFINLLQSVVTEHVDLIEPHDHLNPIFIPKCDGPWRVDYCEVMLELNACGIPSWFGEV